MSIDEFKEELGYMGDDMVGDIGAQSWQTALGPYPIEWADTIEKLDEWLETTADVMGEFIENLKNLQEYILKAQDNLWRVYNE